MPKPQEDNLKQLDKILDKMLMSEDFRHEAAQSGVESLRVAAMLIDAPKPQLSSASKQSIKQYVLDTISSDSRPLPDATKNRIFSRIIQAQSDKESALDNLTKSEAAQAFAQASDDSSLQAAVFLAMNAHPELSDSARARILNQLLDHATQESATESARAPLFAETATEPSLPAAMKDRIFESVLEAQQQLQIESLISSDEALEIAAENPDPIIQAAVALKTAPVPTLSADTKARILERILPQEERETKRVLRPNFAASFQRVAASIAILFLVSMIAIPRASADSLPGDLLYPVKRGLENVSLQLAGSDDARATVHLNNADERLEELNTLLTQGQYLPNLLDDAFASLEAASTLASEADAIHTDRVFRSNFSAALMSLSGIVQNYSTHLDTASSQAFMERQNALSVIMVQLPDENSTPIAEPTIEASLVPTEEATNDETSTLQASVEAQTVSVPDLSAETQASPEQSSIITLYANATAAVRVRNAPSLNAPVIANISHGDAVTRLAISEDAQWIQVRLADGQEGWIASTLLVDYPTSPQSTTASTAAESATDAAANSGNAANAANSNGNANGSSNSNGNANGNSSGNANGNSSGNANGNSNGNANGNSNGNANGNN